MGSEFEVKAADEKVADTQIENGSGPKELLEDAAAKGQAVTGYEELTIWQTVKTFKIATAVCFAASFTAGTDGYQMGINGAIIVNQGFVNQFATKFDSDGAPYLAAPILSGWSSIMSVGQIIGMTTVPFISNRYGRKVAMYWFWSVVAASVLAESLARTWPVWLVGKLLAGIGVGCIQVTIPPYITECAPIRIRGGLLMFYTFWFTLGALMGLIALRQMSLDDPNNWLTPIYTQWAQVGIMFIIFVLLPETPVWCASRGNEERAKASLKKLNRDVPGYDSDYQYKVLVMLHEHERAVAAEQNREAWHSIFRGVDGRRTLAALWAGLSQQLIGLKLFGTFAIYFFQQAGVKDPFNVICITGSVQMATVIFTIFTADYFGRRILSCSAVTLSWIACVVTGILGVTPETKPTTYVFILFACLWNVGMIITGATFSGFIGEVSSQRLRPYTAGFAFASACVIGVVMDVVVPYMLNSNEWNWGLKTGWFFAGVGLIAVVGMWLLIPETKNRSAAELDELFERKIKPWRFAKTETATERLVKAE